MNDKLKLEKESHALQNEKFTFLKKCSCYTDWQPLFRYELYFRDIAAYENEETMRRIFPPAFIVKKRDNYRYVAYPFFSSQNVCNLCAKYRNQG